MELGTDPLPGTKKTLPKSPTHNFSSTRDTKNVFFEVELKNTKKKARSEGQVKTITICEHHKVGVTDGETNKNKMRFGRTKTMLEQSAPGSGHTFCVDHKSNSRQIVTPH